MKKYKSKYIYQYPNKKYTKKNKDQQLKRSYGISLETLNNMIKFQDNRCDICNKEFNEDRKPCVDHCHSTGNVRGILCKKCNTSLGMADDNLDIISSMLQYLIKHSP